MDRNHFSPTYGCFHRDYWLDKTSDFPDAVRQFGVHSLALVYRHQFPGNIYQHSAKIRAWAIAGMEFWASIQHGDGSFDEFYPYERGWVGPTAFTTYTVVEAFKLLEDEIPLPAAGKIKEAIQKAAHFIGAGESEEDHLANHHAMACLAIFKAQRLLDDPELEAAYKRAWKVFLTYHNSAEGWSREYDGVDPGYLSATVSFLGKIYQDNPDPEILEVCRQSIEMCSYFAYPNGYYAGSLGSRNTLHFYPHGFEVFTQEVPLAGAVAEKMLQGLAEDKLVPPEIISDRYVFYRVPEYLLSWLDYGQRPDVLPPLPYQRPDNSRFFQDAGIFTAKRQRYWVIANLAKGGVIKAFDVENDRLLLNDCGMVGGMDNGQTVTSQWIDPSYQFQVTEDGFDISGAMQVVPSQKLFNLLKNIIFRTVLFLLGPSPRFSHWLKGAIRRSLMLGSRKAPASFRRQLSLGENGLVVRDEVRLRGKEHFASLSFGDEFFVRYVPQSRYFQAQELSIQGLQLSEDQLNSLNSKGEFNLETSASLDGVTRRVP